MLVVLNALVEICRRDYQWNEINVYKMDNLHMYSSVYSKVKSLEQRALWGHDNNIRLGGWTVRNSV